MEKKNYLFTALLRGSLKAPKADERSQSTNNDAWPKWCSIT